MGWKNLKIKRTEKNSNINGLDKPKNWNNLKIIDLKNELNILIISRLMYKNYVLHDSELITEKVPLNLNAILGTIDLMELKLEIICNNLPKCLDIQLLQYIYDMFSHDTCSMFSMSGSVASHMNPYAAYASAWNTYNMATFQGLQRAGVSYGRNIYRTTWPLSMD